MTFSPWHRPRQSPALPPRVCPESRHSSEQRPSKHRHHHERRPIKDRHSRESGNPEPRATVAHREKAIYLTRLNLLNFRNYRSLSLDLGPGLILIEGGNGRGKSNLLEAVYLLAIAKSPRAASERDLLHRSLPGQSSPALQGATSEKKQTYWGENTQVSATVRRGHDDVTLRVDYQSARTDDGGSTSLRKSVRVNDAPRRATDLVGQMTAVMFAAVDLELVYGSPSARRRYLDILISQLDREYLRTAQRYQRVAYQRNHLLRAIRDRRAAPHELAFWDDQIVREGSYLVAARSRVVDALSGLTGPVHEELTDAAERLAIDYLPSIDIPGECDRAAAAAAFRSSLDAARDRELAQGATLHGPHRDDLRIEIDGMPAGPFASRGQARTCILSLRLAEAKLLEQRRGDGPVLLLDDVLSELDNARREKILRRAREYDQCIITTPEVHPSDEPLLAGATRFTLEDNTITPA